jgi:hypothetical protein
MKHIFVALITVGFLSACGGGGGGGSDPSSSTTTTTTSTTTTTTTAPAVFASQVTISSDIAKNAYPPLYTVVAPTPVIDDTCLVAADSISYPVAYQGAFTLPPVKGNFASANIGLGVGVKDNWGDGYLANPNINKKCATDNRTAFTATLKRLKALGSSYVYIPQYGCLKDATNPISFLGQISIPDADLVWMGQQVQAQGMKARLMMGVCSNDQKGNLLNNLTLNNQWYSTFFDTYSAFALHQAQLAQTAGFDAISLDWGDWQPASWAPASSIRSARLQQLSVSMRQIFTGRQMLYTTWNSNDCPSGLVASVDLLMAQLGTSKLTPAQSNALTVGQLLPGFIQSINWRQHLGNAKPIIWILQMQSHKDFFVNGWVEDAGCWSTTCAGSFTTDFSVQAIGIEAALEAINQQTFFKTESVFVNSYWLADTVTPRDSFPNISASIRNKPAESVVYQWWKK